MGRAMQLAGNSKPDTAIRFRGLFSLAPVFGSLLAQPYAFAGASQHAVAGPDADVIDGLAAGMLRSGTGRWASGLKSGLHDDP